MSGISRVLAASQDFTKKVLTKEAEAHAKMIIEIRKQVYAKVALKDEGMQNDFVRENHNMEDAYLQSGDEWWHEWYLHHLLVDQAEDAYLQSGDEWWHEWYLHHLLVDQAEAHAKMIIEIRKQVYAKVALKDEGMQNDFVRENHNMEDFTKKVLTKEAEAAGLQAHAKMIIEIRKQVYAKVALKDEGMQNDFVRENHNMEERGQRFDEKCSFASTCSFSRVGRTFVGDFAIRFACPGKTRVG
ncbi:unnamed protein product [Effrenium voratum]|uniref:Uncharacterized protein n=1 Tax=Effrenium voratum TaxID=2562239 RepID=A0AA36I8Q5_9DINO|nr:unnamed protein product [Effrenium voratum]